MLDLAYAETADSSDLNLRIVLVCIAVVGVVCALAFVPVAVAWARQRKRSDTILAAAVLWGLLTAGSVANTAIAEMKWSREWLVRVQSGYYDPKDTSDAPVRPWRAWAGLAAGYCGLVGWSLIQRRPPADPPPQ